MKDLIDVCPMQLVKYGAAMRRHHVFYASAERYFARFTFRNTAGTA